MTPTPLLSVDEIDFADPLFWARSLAERDAAFATLRAERPLAYHREFEIPGFPVGPGYWSLVRHDHVTLASRQPELFRVSRGYKGQGARRLRRGVPTTPQGCPSYRRRLGLVHARWL